MFTVSHCISIIGDHDQYRNRYMRLRYICIPKLFIPIYKNFEVVNACIAHSTKFKHF